MGVINNGKELVTARQFNWGGGSSSVMWGKGMCVGTVWVGAGVCPRYCVGWGGHSALSNNQLVCVTKSGQCVCVCVNPPRGGQVGNACVGKRVYVWEGTNKGNKQR